jgi:hypothetical protein
VLAADIVSSFGEDILFPVFTCSGTPILKNYIKKFIKKLIKKYE